MGQRSQIAHAYSIHDGFFQSINRRHEKRKQTHCKHSEQWTDEKQHMNVNWKQGNDHGQYNWL